MCDIHVQSVLATNILLCNTINDVWAYTKVLLFLNQLFSL